MAVVDKPYAAPPSAPSTSTVPSMTEQPPDIPPWSPLADRGREDGGAQPGADGAAHGAGSAVPGAVSVQDPGRSPDTVGDREPATAPARVRIHRAWWAVGGLAVGLLLAIALVVLTRDGTPTSATTTLVRSPLPATSFEEPAALGTRVALGNGWTVAVRGADAGATRALGRINTRSPLAEGQQYVLIDLEMTYVDGATDADSPFHGVDLGVVGDDGELVTPADSPCTAPAPAFDVASEVPRGRGERGRICFAVGTDQVASLRLVAEPSMTYGSTPSWFALSLGG